MKRILGLAIAFMLLIGMTSIGTFAYFSDTETSTGNTLSAGTLDLKTNDADGVSATLYMTNMAPGSEVGPQTVTLKNSGSIDASSLSFSFSYIENDGSPNPANMSADATAGQIEVTTMTYGGSSLISTITDMNSNGYKDIYDLKNDDLSGYAGINGSATKDFVIGVTLRSETGNDYQADGVDITMTFTLNQ